MTNEGPSLVPPPSTPARIARLRACADVVGVAEDEERQHVEHSVRSGVHGCPELQARVAHGPAHTGRQPDVGGLRLVLDVWKKERHLVKRDAGAAPDACEAEEADRDGGPGKGGGHAERGWRSVGGWCGDWGRGDSVGVIVDEASSLCPAHIIVVQAPIASKGRPAAHDVHLDEMGYELVL